MLADIVAKPQVIQLLSFWMPKMKRSRSKREPKSGLVDVIIETPKGSRNKFKYDDQFRQFRLDKVLPVGASFPYDFGFVPGTRADDGDPLDVMLLMDEPAFPGCLVPSRVIGVIEANQTEENGKTVRNDRLIGVAEDAHHYRGIRTIDDVDQTLLKELGHFFESYHAMRKTRFKVLGIRGMQQAWKLLKKARQKYEEL